MELTKKMLAQLKRYLADNYVGDKRVSMKRSSKTVRDVVRELDENLEAPILFSQCLFSLIEKKGLSEVEVYKKAHIDRRLFSKIRTKKEYTPKKNTVLSLAFAMELSHDEMNDLLDHAGYSLSRFHKDDMIVRFFVQKGYYDLFLVNEALIHYGFPPLSNR